MSRGGATAAGIHGADHCLDRHVARREVLYGVVLCDAPNDLEGGVAVAIELEADVATGDTERLDAEVREQANVRAKPPGALRVGQCHVYDAGPRVGVA